MSPVNPARKRHEIPEHLYGTIAQIVNGRAMYQTVANEGVRLVRCRECHGTGVVCADHVGICAWDVVESWAQNDYYLKALTGRQITALAVLFQGGGLHHVDVPDGSRCVFCDHVDRPGVSATHPEGCPSEILAAWMAASVPTVWKDADRFYFSRKKAVLA